MRPVYKFILYTLERARDGIHKSYRLSLSLSLSLVVVYWYTLSDVSSFGQRYDDSMCLYVFLILRRCSLLSKLS